MTKRVRKKAKAKAYVSSNNIAKAVKEQIWIQHFGETFRHKCYIPWCTNSLTPFSFHAGHDVPRSKGGTNTIDNLFPICSSCNCSMGNKYSIQEWIHINSKLSFKRQICTSVLCFIQRLFY